MTDPQTESYLDQIRETGFMAVRQLEDGTIIALGKLLFTTAIYIDVDLVGWGQRFCFKDPQLALSEFQRLENGDQEPEGFIARRPDFQMCPEAARPKP